jgi:hypothetical protein
VKNLGGAWWGTPVVPATQSLRQDLEASLGQTARPCLLKKKKNKKLGLQVFRPVTATFAVCPQAGDFCL